MSQVGAVPQSCSILPEKPPAEKAHVCSHPGCNKRFTRAEHLRRHALNHKNEDNTCERCGVHFNRPDLLASSIQVTEAVNSSSTSSSASIRSFNDKAATPPGSHNQDSSSNLTSPPSIGELNYHGQDHGAGSVAPISPPTSVHPSCSSVNLDSGALDNCQPVHHPDPLIAPMVPGGPYEPYAEPIPGQFDAADGSWRSQDLGPGMDYEEFFDLDTATSFNMPFAATHNYNWLFDVTSLDDAFNHSDVSLAMDMVSFAEPVPDMWSQTQQRDNEFFSQPISSASESARNPSSISSDPPIQPSGDASSSVEFPVDRSQTSPSSPVQISTATLDDSNQLTLSTFSNMDWIGQTPSTKVVLRKLPQISEAARTRLLRLVSQLQPMTVEGNRIELSSPLLSINALQTYCDLFFTKFNVSYPLIHQPTFDPDRIDTLLLAAMVSMGASYSTMEAHQLAVGMHDSLRNQLFSHQSFSPQPDLWVLQAMMLIDCFGKQRAGLKQREMSQLFHCVLIKLIRRSNCQLIRTSPVAERPDNLDSAWRQAMDLEQRKRLAMLCFMWDTQHAVLFSQSLCMSAFEIRTSLPCDEATWEARTAEEWFECSHAEKPHSAFLLVLKAYITPNTTNRPRYLNALSRIFLLHGLMSISSDLKRRDQTTLRSETPNLVGAWKARIGRSYDLWKNDFDADCMDMKLNQTSDPRKFVGLKTATNVMYHAAHITLNVEVLDLQIYAGAPHILGRLVTASDFDRSQRVVTRWLNEDPHSAAKATRHASYILQDAIMNLNDWDETDVFHYPWCLYLATLTCWAFHLPTSSSSPCSSSTALVRRTEISNDNNSEQQGQQQQLQHPSPAPRIPGSISLNPRNEVATLVIAMTTCNTLEDLSSLAGKFDTTGLTCIMSQQLASVRWAVVHDAMKVLVTLSSR
ncbi:conserved hypothetical protein [Histoplasma capsulatum G186AR]|uniref:C2H2-type domain-containing protein n=1 Tax=Ajellomyces capsulatus (strain G186AR / H82 / ATCC MYA-2454 / RMSCC 2432) TaxID=447093 RepID=C0P184_AJECG|nr:uncharacterized protein HCBG_09164 [Histoplasma capsulatum G186AR]EEH02599.1 conserved hypothetical protein [Histoplasma capsulatum G186AR]